MPGDSIIFFNSKEKVPDVWRRQNTLYIGKNDKGVEEYYAHLPGGTGIFTEPDLIKAIEKASGFKGYKRIDSYTAVELGSEPSYNPPRPDLRVR